MLFRFAFAYIAIYCFPFPLAIFLFPSPIRRFYEQHVWHAFVPWFGARILHLSHPITNFIEVSDSTYGYVTALCMLLFAIVAAAIWSIADRRRVSYAGLHKWLKLYLRLYLAMFFVSYGAAKVIPAQMPAPPLFRLLERYGDSAPMGLLWTTIGASRGYECFNGTVEMLAGILLCIPALTTIGALVGAAAMTNVFALNMGYDVPIKVFSFHLLLGSIFLLLPDLRRLANVFFLNRPVEAAPAQPLFRRPRWNRLALQLIFAVAIITAYLHQAYAQYTFLSPAHARLTTPFYGMWFVDSFTSDGTLRPPLVTDPIRWQRVMFEFDDWLSVQTMDGRINHFLMRLNDAKDRMDLSGTGELVRWKGNLRVQSASPAQIALTGSCDGHKVEMRLRREEPNFLLTTRGFHWINEAPFMR